MTTKGDTEKKTVTELRISRFYKADRRLVWRFWTEPELLALWLGPKGATGTTVKTDLRVGGKNLIYMHSPEGKDFWGTNTFIEIKEPEKLVMTDSFADEKGNVVDASYYGMGEDFPRAVNHPDL